MKQLNIKQGKLWKQWRIHCNHCGADDYVPYWLIKIKFLFSNRFKKHCSVCHKQSSYLIQFNVIHDTLDKSEKLFNKSKLFDNRIR